MGMRTESTERIGSSARGITRLSFDSVDTGHPEQMVKDSSLSKRIGVLEGEACMALSLEITSTASLERTLISVLQTFIRECDSMESISIYRYDPSHVIVLLVSY
jgi:hypothetical protein